MYQYEIFSVDDLEQIEVPLNENYFLSTNHGKVLVFDDHYYHKTNSFSSKTYWRCKHSKRLKCRARLTTTLDKIIVTNAAHNHPPMNRLTYGTGMDFYFVTGQRSAVKLVYNGYDYVKSLSNSKGTKWICATKSRTKCRARLRINDNYNLEILHSTHNHNNLRRYKRKIFKKKGAKYEVKYSEMKTVAK